MRSEDGFGHRAGLEQAETKQNGVAHNAPNGLRDSSGNTAATLGMMAVMLPAFFLGMYEKNGQSLEKLLSYYVQSRFVRPKIRPYKTNNYYAILMKGGMTHDPVLEKNR